jgi:hypothetical protein
MGRLIENQSAFFTNTHALSAVNNSVLIYEITHRKPR